FPRFGDLGAEQLPDLGYFGVECLRWSRGNRRDANTAEGNEKCRRAFHQVPPRRAGRRRPLRIPLACSTCKPPLDGHAYGAVRACAGSSGRNGAGARLGGALFHQVLVEEVLSVKLEAVPAAKLLGFAEGGQRFVEVTVVVIERCEQVEPVAEVGVTTLLKNQTLVASVSGDFVQPSDQANFVLAVFDCLREGSLCLRNQG